MKNILVISASPRKGGNSDVLCDEFIKGAQQAGHKVEKIFLRNFKVNYCTGCGVCNSTHKWVQKDDMAEIMDKMVNADQFLSARNWPLGAALSVCVVIFILLMLYLYSRIGNLDDLGAM